MAATSNFTARRQLDVQLAATRCEVLERALKMPAAGLKRVPSLAQKDLLDIQQLLKQAHARANEIEAEGQSVRPALDALEGQVTAAAAQLAAASAAAALELRLAQDAALQAQRRTDELEAVTRVEGERDLAHIQKLTDALAAAEAARGAAEEAAAAQKRRAHEDENTLFPYTTSYSCWPSP